MYNVLNSMSRGFDFMLTGLLSLQHYPIVLTCLKGKQINNHEGEQERNRFGVHNWSMVDR